MIIQDKYGNIIINGIEDGGSISIGNCNIQTNGNSIIIGNCNNVRTDKIEEEVCDGIRFIEISGANGKHEIESEEPMDIEISGANNDVYIKKSAKIISIILKGSNNSVKYPRSENPRIKTSGSNNDILNY